ncbi:hypothetical protein C8F04DRAFT_1195410 [Mycena alexandri]|uniref:Uncharacterized protein n=1 Tax=Mycena alexandri TaxID=1745969 RepID=A0AAD6S6H2_9AGAR|nr:hypothetical protein C8F04DRAFT_1195410 [Mycena alexandri]
MAKGKRSVQWRQRKQGSNEIVKGQRSTTQRSCPFHDAVNTALKIRAAVKAKHRVSDGPRRAKLAASKLAAAEVAASEVLTKMLELKQAPNEPSQPDEEEEELSEWEPPGPETFALWRANQAKEKAELQASGEWSESEEECGGGSRQGTPLESVSGRSSDVAHETGGHVEPGARNASNSSSVPVYVARGRRSIRLPTPSSNSPSPEPKGRLPNFYDMLWKSDNGYMAIIGSSEVTRMAEQRRQENFIAAEDTIDYATGLGGGRRRTRGHGRRNSNPLLHTRGRGDVDGRRRLNRVRNEGVVVGRGRVVLAVHVEGLAPGLLLPGE